MAGWAGVFGNPYAHLTYRRSRTVQLPTKYTHTHALISKKTDGRGGEARVPFFVDNQFFPDLPVYIFVIYEVRTIQIHWPECVYTRGERGA